MEFHSCPLPDVMTYRLSCSIRTCLAKDMWLTGFKDERVKGLAELEYSFKKKKEYANEFPIHSLKLRYESDVNQYGAKITYYTSKDNVFLALKHQGRTVSAISGRRR